MLASVIYILLVVTVSLGNANISATESEDKCRRWASEDGVPATHTANYIQECIADQAATPEPYPATNDAKKSSDAEQNVIIENR